MNDIIIFYNSIVTQKYYFGKRNHYFWLIENAYPLFNFNYKKWHHASINILTVTTIVINFILAFILLQTADWTIANEFGILQWLPQIPLWLYVVIGLLLLDLIGAYLVHFVEHKTKFLYFILSIIQILGDTTSANRHHPGESIIRFTFTTLGVLIVGSSYVDDFPIPNATEAAHEKRTKTPTTFLSR
jgi:hypothetical protein